MSDYVNKITLENGTVYDIHDQRVDNLSSGTKLYLHNIKLKTSASDPYPSGSSITLVSTSSTVLTTFDEVYNLFTALDYVCLKTLGIVKILTGNEGSKFIDVYSVNYSNQTVGGSYVRNQALYNDTVTEL